MAFTFGLSIYFGQYLYFVEQDSTCIATTKDGIEYQIYSSIDQISDHKFMKSLRVQDVSNQFQFTIQIIFFQAVVLYIISVINFLSHFFVPKILMYAKQIKFVNTVNLVLVGVICLMVLINYRFNEGAHQCSKQILVKRGGFLWNYTAIVVTTSLTFIGMISTFCVCNLKKMGF